MAQDNINNMQTQTRSPFIIVVVVVLIVLAVVIAVFLRKGGYISSGLKSKVDPIDQLSDSHKVQLLETLNQANGSTSTMTSAQKKQLLETQAAASANGNMSADDKSQLLETINQ